MKITNIETIVVRIPRSAAAGSSGFGGKAWATIDTLLVRVDTDEGITGWGEAFGYNIIPATRVTIDEVIAPLVIGRDASQIEPMMAELHHKLHIFGRSGPAIFGLGGIDIALWDIAGKRAGMPVHQLLGGTAHKDLPAYASLMPYGDPKRVADVVGRTLEEGYEYVKLHETTTPATRAARDAAPDVKLMLDTNCPWTLREASRMAIELEECNLFWLEEPIWPPENYAGLAHLRTISGIPLAAGENATTVMQFEQMFEAGAVDVAQPSPTKVGGITELRKVATLAAAHNVTVVPHTPYFGPGFLAGLNVSSTLARETPIEWLYTGMTTTLYGDAIEPKNGRVTVPTGPGLGIDPDPKVIAEFRDKA
ncbi:MAG: mandelate racemase/muconate lactonizing enzyme family protein [Betaproteobacteria bacterium]|nr:mandelate racemase/muconate lactonizing enzyme family protein [Betaproteobacteria bacterium]